LQQAYIVGWQAAIDIVLCQHPSSWTGLSNDVQNALGLGLQFVILDRFRNNPPGICFVSRNFSGGQHHVFRLGQSDKVRQARAHMRVRDAAKQFRDTKGRTLPGNRDVAEEDQVQAARMAFSRDRADDNLAASFEVAKWMMVRRIRFGHQGIAVLHLAGHIPPNAEPAVHALDAHGINFGGLVGHHQSFLQTAVHILGHRVPLGQPVNPDVEDAAVQMGVEVLGFKINSIVHEVHLSRALLNTDPRERTIPRFKKVAPAEPVAYPPQAGGWPNHLGTHAPKGEIMPIRFDGKVAIVTGAGGGLGRSHALQLAERGALVVVNDLGGAVDGSGGSSEAAEKVVAEIKAAGGQAVANGSSVSDRAGAEKLIDDAVSAFGRIDILINNAGILRDRTFKKMTLDDFHLVVDVHLMGTVYCTHFAWEKMLGQGYGRIVNTTSSSGLYGNFGQSNYGAAKMGVVGLMNVLKLEGQKSNVHINTIAPTAGTRMTENIGFPKEAFDALTPELVSPAVLYLASEDAPTGTIIQAGAGYYAKVAIVEATGAKLGAGATVDDIAENFEAISDLKDAVPMNAGGDVVAKIFG